MSLKLNELLQKNSLQIKLRNKTATIQTLENCIRSALSYAIATLHIRFKVGKGMNKSQCNKLSLEAQKP